MGCSPMDCSLLFTLLVLGYGVLFAVFARATRDITRDAREAWSGAEQAKKELLGALKELDSVLRRAERIEECSDTLLESIVERARSRLETLLHDIDSLARYIVNARRNLESNMYQVVREAETRLNRATARLDSLREELLARHAQLLSHITYVENRLARIDAELKQCIEKIGAIEERLEEKSGDRVLGQSERP